MAHLTVHGAHGVWPGQGSDKNHVPPVTQIAIGMFRDWLDDSEWIVSGVHLTHRR